MRLHEPVVLLFLDVINHVEQQDLLASLKSVGTIQINNCSDDTTLDIIDKLLRFSKSPTKTWLLQMAIAKANLEGISIDIVIEEILQYIENGEEEENVCTLQGTRKRKLTNAHRKNSITKEENLNFKENTTSDILKDMNVEN
ncbi:hypothetical protein ABK040_010846 [Willaertia magna]